MNQTIDAAIARGWRQLGFWYDYTPESGWILRGSKIGLGRLADELEKYASDPRNDNISEHEHLGPHMYLKLVTWDSAEINSDGIYGSLQDMRRLADLIRTQLASSREGGTVSLSPIFSEASRVQMVLHIESNTFDPASYDVQKTLQADSPDSGGPTA